MVPLTHHASDAPTRAVEVFPDGSNGEFGLPTHLARVIVRGSGCRLHDSSAREMIDFSIGWGSVLPGHAHPDIVHAVAAAAANGTNFAYTNAHSLALAEELVRLSPACEQVRFCASGTEATMYCLRLARASSGRPLILKFEGAYHGAGDVGVTSLFPSRLLPFPQAEPTSAGIDAANTLVAPYNDLHATRQVIEQHARQLGAVIVEPFQRCLSPAPGFLEGLRDACHHAAIPLIFDEVVTGFRLAYAGAQERYGVIPDLVAYGKALGGGLPIGAFGGRRDIMDLVRESRIDEPDYVWTASSLGGNPVSCAAACAALRIYRRSDTYQTLESLGQYFRAGLARVARDTGHSAQILGEGPLAQIVFSDQPVHDYRSARGADRAKARAVMLALFERDVFLNPMGTKLYLSLAHGAGVCDEFLTRLRDVLQAL